MKLARQLGFLLALLAAYPAIKYVDSTMRPGSTSWGGLVDLLAVFFLPPMSLLVLVFLAGLEMDSGSQTAPKGELEFLLHQKHHGVLHRARRIQDATAKSGSLVSKRQNPPRPWDQVLHQPEKVLDRLVKVKRQAALALAKRYQGAG
jgi:hypothetical protein